MRLPFRYQFLLAPLSIVLILAGLIAYTLYELSNINRENEISRQWELLSDRMQTLIASSNRLQQLIGDMNSEQSTSPISRDQDDQFFSYLDQSRIVLDNLQEPMLRELKDEILLSLLDKSASLLREPERVPPVHIRDALSALTPLLEYQYKIIAAQRRSAFIDNHRQLVHISSRMTSTLLVGLIVCVLLAVLLALWGGYVVRRRLMTLSQRAHAVCEGRPQAMPAPQLVRDELDDLESCLSEMTKRLLTVVRAEQVIRGVEGERRRLAMDMHDGALAELTAILRRVDSPQVELQPALRDEMRTAIHEVIDGLRRSIDDLHPQVLETLGLEAALSSLIKRTGLQPGSPSIHLEFDNQLESRLTLEQKLSLFRILSEAIHNALQHARARQIEVSLLGNPTGLCASVEDNGIGMPDDRQKVAGYGCANMLERANLIGATLQWCAPRFSSGTRVELKLSL